MQLFEKQAVILYSLLTASSPKTGNVLSKKTNLSLKTVKKEIDLLNDMSDYMGFQITSRYGIGYEIEVIDETHYNDFKRAFTSIYHRNHYFKDNQNERAHFIVRRLLSNDGNLFLDDLASECYCSLSIINRDMVQVKEILSSYNIKVKNHTSHGLRIEGNEWDIRLAFIGEHKIYKNFNKDIIHEERDFGRFFFENEDAYAQVRNILKEELVKAKVLIPQINFAKIIYMILLSFSRKKYFEHLKNADTSIEQRKTSRMFQVSKTIYERLEAQYDVLWEEIDVLYLTTLLKSYRILKYDAFLEVTNYEKSIELAEQFIDYFDLYVPIKHYDLTEFKQDLSCNLETFGYRCRHNIHIDPDSVINFQKDGLINVDHSLILAKFLKEKTNWKFNILDVLSLYHLFALLNRKLVNQNVKKVMIISKFGYYYAKNMCANFERLEMSCSIEFIPVEFFELDQFDINEFDFVCTDIVDAKQKGFNDDIIELYYYRTHAELNAFINQINCPKEYQKKDLIDEKTILYVDNIEDKEDLMEFVQFKVLNEFENGLEYLKDIEERSKMLNPLRKNQIAILRSFKDTINESFFKIIVSDKPFKWDDGMCEMVFLYNVNNNDISTLNYFTRFISKMLHRDEVLFTFNSQTDISMLKNILKE